MEQSTKPVDSLTPPPVGDSDLASVQAPAVVLPVHEVIKLEKNLAQLGFFTPSTKKIKSAKEKTTTIVTTVDGKKIEATATIVPSAKYGLPITADQDTLLAIMKIATDLRQQYGKLPPNPISFTSAELFRIQGKSAQGKHYRDLAEQLLRIRSTGIESHGAVYLSTKKTFAVDSFGVLDRVVMFGQELENGTVADKNYVWLAEWLRANIDANHVLPLDYELYKKLTTHIGKALAPLLQIWLYASVEDGRFEKRYEELCQLLNTKVYPYASLIKQTLGPALTELTALGMLSDWQLETTADRKSFKIVFFHGEKFHANRRHQLSQRQTAQKLASGEPSPRRTHRPRQTHLPLQPEVDAQLLAAMMGRGISETAARKLLTELPAGYPTLDTLEWGDTQVSTSRGKITNPPGFYISLLRDRTTPPPTFESSQVRKARQESDLRKQQALQEEEARRLAEEEAEEQRLDQFQAAEPERYRALYDQAKTELYSQFPNLARYSQGREDSAMHDGAIRARIKIALRQARSQAAAAFAASLQATLSTPQLPAPKLSPALPEKDTP